MSRRPTPPGHLTHGFHQAGLSWYLHGEQAPDHVLRLYDGGPACWLARFDPFERPCEGRLEVVHLISRQRIRNIMRPLLCTDLWAEGAIDPGDVEDLVQLAEWDDRNAAPGCTGHHRRFDNQQSPGLKVPIEGLRAEAIEFILERGLDSEAERRFSRALPSPPPSEVGAAAGLQQQPQPLGPRE